MKRNEETRRALTEKIEALKAEKREALKRIEDEEDDIYFTIEDRYTEEIDKLIQERFFLEYPEPRNTWFRTFAESFETEKGRRISQKQAAVFMRYLEESHTQEYGRGLTYYGRVGKRGFKMTYFSTREPAFLTIIEF